MMAVGDDQLPIPHLFLHGGNDRGIGDLPDAVRDTVLVGDLNVWVRRRIEQGIYLARPAVQHENLAEVGSIHAQQVEPVGLRLGQRLLVPEHDARGVFLDPAECDEAPPFGPRLGSENASWSAFRNSERLGISVDRRLGIPSQNAGLAPVLERRCRSRIDVPVVAVPRQAFSENNPHQVIRTGLVVAFLHCRGDFVVGLGHNLLDRHALGIVAPSLKWRNECHRGKAEL